MKTEENGILLFKKGLLEINPIMIKYSKYALSLDKVFKNKCLATFQYNFKNPKRFFSKNQSFNPNQQFEFE